MRAVVDMYQQRPRSGRRGAAVLNKPPIYPAMSFVFVGGTAAHLLLAGGVSRLSKDVDVIAPDSSADDWRRAVAAIAERFGGEVYQVAEEQRDHVPWRRSLE